MPIKIVGIVGSYRRDGAIDRAVGAILRAAAAAGAQTSTIYLLEKNIAFCRNCRTCTQAPGAAPGQCVLDDDMAGILAEIESADAIVLGAPVNFFDVNALTKRFIERLLCYAYWPWGQLAPTYRLARWRKRAVLVTSSAMPGFMVGFFTGARRSLKVAAKMLGARPEAVLAIGLIAREPTPKLSPRLLKKAQAIGRRLAR